MIIYSKIFKIKIVELPLSPGDPGNPIGPIDPYKINKNNNSTVYDQLDVILIDNYNLWFMKNYKHNINNLYYHTW